MKSIFQACQARRPRSPPGLESPGAGAHLCRRNAGIDPAAQKLLQSFDSEDGGSFCIEELDRNLFHIQAHTHPAGQGWEEGLECPSTPPWLHSIHQSLRGGGGVEAGSLPEADATLNTNPLPPTAKGR